MIKNDGQWEPDPMTLHICRNCGKLWAREVPNGVAVVDLSEMLKSVEIGYCRASACQLEYERNGYQW